MPCPCLYFGKRLVGGADMAVVQASRVQAVQARRRRTSRARRRTVAFFMFIVPWLLGFVFLMVIPLVVGFLGSMTNYDGLNLDNIKFLGLRNYTRAFTDSDTRFAFGRTLLWAAINLPSWIILSFILALILNQDVRGRGLFRTLYYLPSIVPAVATVWVWKIFLDKNVGLLNGIISIFRPGTAIPWLSTYALQGLTAVSVWGGLGWGMIVFLAGLQDIPDELVEAARIDGANTLQVFRHVTIPLVTPVIFFVLVNGLIGSFQALVIPLLLASGGGSTGLPPVPPRSVYLYMIHVYHQIFDLARFGYGLALVWILFALIAVLTVVVFKTERYWVHSEMAVGEEQ
jgi:ABC-type sugar transport system permease subunit